MSALLNNWLYQEPIYGKINHDGVQLHPTDIQLNNNLNINLLDFTKCDPFLMKTFMVRENQLKNQINTQSKLTTLNNHDNTIKNYCSPTHLSMYVYRYDPSLNLNVVNSSQPTNETVMQLAIRKNQKFSLYSNNKDTIVVMRLKDNTTLVYDTIVLKRPTFRNQIFNWTISCDEIASFSNTYHVLTNMKLLLTGIWWYFDSGILLNGYTTSNSYDCYKNGDYDIYINHYAHTENQENYRKTHNDEKITIHLDSYKVTLYYEFYFMKPILDEFKRLSQEAELARLREEREEQQESLLQSQQQQQQAQQGNHDNAFSAVFDKSLNPPPPTQATNWNPPSMNVTLKATYPGMSSNLRNAIDQLNLPISLQYNDLLVTPIKNNEAKIKFKNVLVTNGVYFDFTKLLKILAKNPIYATMFPSIYWFSERTKELNENNINYFI